MMIGRILGWRFDFGEIVKRLRVVGGIVSFKQYSLHSICFIKVIRDGY